MLVSADSRDHGPSLPATCVVTRWPVASKGRAEGLIRGWTLQLFKLSHAAVLTVNGKVDSGRALPQRHKAWTRRQAARLGQHKQHGVTSLSVMMTVVQ